METISQKDRLKNKFSKLEMDFEDESFQYKITSDSVKKLQTHSQMSDERSLLNISWRGIKIASNTCILMGKRIYSSVVKVAFLYCIKLIKKTVHLVKTKQENLEIHLDKKISEVELAKKEEEEVQNFKIHIYQKLNRIYSEELTTMFESVLLEHKLELENIEHDRLSHIHVCQLEIFNVLHKKLTASHMILNVKNLKINTTLNDKNIISTNLICEMDKRGHLWALMFGKHIVPELNKILHKKSGKIAMKQISHLSKMEETFEFSFQYNFNEDVAVKTRFASPIMQRQDF